jgi:hypothetical protein
VRAALPHGLVVDVREFDRYFWHRRARNDTDAPTFPELSTLAGFK